mmetsp:Transcript_25941/g.50801  ORF Transcript_25941/g.50801 Transcript_25941/m.50801 type:complete len:93 (-) Transcript_25941:133-411(-)
MLDSFARVMSRPQKYLAHFFVQNVSADTQVHVRDMSLHESSQCHRLESALQSCLGNLDQHVRLLRAHFEKIDDWRVFTLISSMCNQLIVPCG